MAPKTKHAAAIPLAEVTPVAVLHHDDELVLVRAHEGVAMANNVGMAQFGEEFSFLDGTCALFYLLYFHYLDHILRAPN